uniref:Wings apart-like protein C-terminal domain-containing protein n=1 Tax=Nelumbo nucifera TaxID=4432 RepID=A0A822XQ74_NELNU|nr:TPA_asm: hypothetical protein HUJ06_022348 [Nelumbo nucifera]
MDSFVDNGEGILIYGFSRRFFSASEFFLHFQCCKVSACSDGNSDASEIPLMEDHGVLRDGTISSNSSRECCSIMEYVFLMKSLRLPQKRQCQFEENIPLSELNNQNEIHLTNHKIDFLVAILGLLVNMVENDRWNRSQIAAASVSLHITLPHQKGTTNESHRDVIPLLCSIFLANQGVSEAAGEDCFHRTVRLLF